MEIDIIASFAALGSFVWLFTWGMNRVYLTFKKFVS